MYIVKVPGINGLGKTNGCEKAGNEILSYLKKLHSTEDGRIIDVNSFNLEGISIDNFNLESSNLLIYKKSLNYFEKNNRTIFLGGDHSISFPLTNAFLNYCRENKKEPCLIIFDAHPDCMPSMKEPTHEEWLRALIEKGFPPENVLIVGLRNSLKEEIDFIKNNKIRTISVNEFNFDLEEVCDVITEFSDKKELYVSLDIDVIDPAFAPATGYPEVGGLTSRQIIYLIQRINKRNNLKAMNLIEINPEKDKTFNMITTKLGAKIIGEIFS